MQNSRSFHEFRKFSTLKKAVNFLGLVFKYICHIMNGNPCSTYYCIMPNNWTIVKNKETKEFEDLNLKFSKTIFMVF